MGNNTWKRKEYETWEEAFMGLCPAVRQQSVRVAAYTQVLYNEACEKHFAQSPEYKEYPDRIKGKYSELAYKCGMYHQIGKALVPEEYQIWQKDFTDEEEAVYRKYTSDGRVLAASLQEKTQRAKGKRTGNFEEIPTSNIPWLMIRESCEQHMEKFDGTGYPLGLKGSEISPIAQIVGLAKMLDRLSAETKSENPFAEAFDAICAEENKAFSPELIEIFKSAKAKCRGVYTKFIHYTMTLPKTVPLVDKHKKRPMGLSYRPIVSAEKVPVAFEAESWFGGIAGREGDRETAADIEPLLKRTDLVADMSFYFLYEATDLLLREQNCKLENDGVLLNMLPGFYSPQSHLQRFTKLFEDQSVNKEKLILTLPQSTVLSANKATLEVISRYIKNGINLLLDGWDYRSFSVDKVRELGIKAVRPDPSLYLSADFAGVLSSLPDLGITVYAAGTETSDAFRWLAACKVSHIAGPICGHEMTEDDIIRELLLKDRENA